MRESAEVVSGPRKMSMAQEQKTEAEKELAEIRREVIESRNLVIKTDNLLKNLHAELKLVGKRQEDFQKRQWFSSAVAYALFAVLAITGSVTAIRASTASSRSEKEQLEQRSAQLTTESEKARADATAKLQSQRAAGEVYRLMTHLPGDERLKGIDALGKLDTSLLSPLEKQALTDRADALREELGQSAFERGKQAFLRNEYGNAINELSRFMTMNPRPDDAAEASYALGLSYNATRKHELAVPLLTKFVTEEKRSKKRDYAMLMLAQSLQEVKQYDKAADICRDALGTYPNSQFAPQLRGRLSSIKREALGTAAPGTEVEVKPVGAPAPALRPSPPRRRLPPAAAPK